MNRPPRTRECPFCGATIDLANCRIISTSAGLDLQQSPTGNNDAAFLDFPATNELEPSTPTDGTSPTLRDADVLHDPEAGKAQSRGGWGFERVLAEDPVRPLTAFPPNLIARRECPACRGTLPPEMDDRDARVLSIVGLNIAGKTNYISTAITLARQGGLADFGVSEFAPDLDTATRFQREYMIPLFRERQVLKGTTVDLRAASKPLGFRVTSKGAAPYLLATHDIAGEALVDHRLRAVSASFVRRSRGVIFILDPLEFDHVRDRVDPASIPASRDIDQADLLEQILYELERAVPLAIVVGKADIVTGLNGHLPSYRNQRPPGFSPLEDLATMSHQVKEFLTHIGQQRIVDLGTKHGMTTFHAVSSLGGTPADVITHGVRPQRVLDPLGVIMQRIAARTSAG